MIKIAFVVCCAAFAAAEAEADAKADAGLLYGAYGYGAGLGYAGLGYAGVGYGYAAPAAYGYSTLGYGGLGYYGKRSADAEPKADADADAGLLYGAYGYRAVLDMLDMVVMDLDMAVLAMLVLDTMARGLLMPS